MTVVLLVESRLLPVPAAIKVVQDYGYVSITHMSVGGDHMILEGEAEDFKNWLRPFDGVWVGKGIPQMQEFEVMHIS